MNKYFDTVIIGGGIYGLYAAQILVKSDKKVLVIEMDAQTCSRATLVNQARVHNGYHYPRSLSTAIKSAAYFNRFSNDFSFAINSTFKQIYSISREFSYTSADQFRSFCTNANILCKEITDVDFLNTDTIEASFETQEYTFDAVKIREYLLETLLKYKNFSIIYSTQVKNVFKDSAQYNLELTNGMQISTAAVINATYASSNQINKLFMQNTFSIKYEICEVILCSVTKNIVNVGITLMDGPFFSLMPFGLTGHHSLTSVTFTPHKDSYGKLPTFNCQDSTVACKPTNLMNCNDCHNKPKSAWVYMNQLAKKYLINVDIQYLKSYYAIKPILLTSEVDDSRPTVITELSAKPRFISILSGKINTIYDLDDIL